MVLILPIIGFELETLIEFDFYVLLVCFRDLAFEVGVLEDINFLRKMFKPLEMKYVAAPKIRVTIKIR